MALSPPFELDADTLDARREESVMNAAAGIWIA
jgi:hypothetical protein